MHYRKIQNRKDVRILQNLCLLYMQTPDQLQQQPVILLTEEFKQHICKISENPWFSQKIKRIRDSANSIKPYEFQKIYKKSLKLYSFDEIL